MHRNRLIAPLALLVCALALVIRPAAVSAQGASDAELAARLFSAINAARIASGLPPYAFNPLLTQSAQAHSEYQRDSGQITHTGPGETRPYDRAVAVGYPAARVNENIYAGVSGPEAAVEWWLTADEPHRHNVLHPSLREVGIGAATNAQGVTYYTLDISAQPNVLPIFINDDAPITQNGSVTITLTNEEVFYGSSQIGYATQVMISNTPDFSGAVIQPWARYISWSLDTRGTGRKTAYVRYIDAAGRTADAEDTIRYDPRSSVALPTAVTVPPLEEAPPDNIITPEPGTSTWTPFPTLTLSPTAPPLPTLTALPPQTTTAPVLPEPGPSPQIIVVPVVVTAPPGTEIAEILTPPAPTRAPAPAPEEPLLPGSHYIVIGIIIAGAGAILIGTISVLRRRLIH